MVNLSLSSQSFVLSGSLVIKKIPQFNLSMVPMTLYWQNTFGPWGQLYLKAFTG